MPHRKVTMRDCFTNIYRVRNFDGAKWYCMLCRNFLDVTVEKDDVLILRDITCQYVIQLSLNSHWEKKAPL